MANLFNDIDIVVDRENNNFNDCIIAINTALTDLEFVNNFANYFLINNIVSSVRTIIKGDESSG